MEFLKNIESSLYLIESLLYINRCLEPYLNNKDKIKDVIMKLDDQLEDIRLKSSNITMFSKNSDPSTNILELYIKNNFQNYEILDNNILDFILLIKSQYTLPYFFGFFGEKNFPDKLTLTRNKILNLVTEKLYNVILYENIENLYHIKEEIFNEEFISNEEIDSLEFISKKSKKLQNNK